MKIAPLMTPCIPWGGVLDKDGYGRRGKKMAHRLAYEAAVGPIPAGLTIDHLCRNRACVNPDHLEPVTRRENTMRGVGLTAVHAAKTHCIHGHPFDDANTYIAMHRDRQGRPTAMRQCRACNLIAVRAYRSARQP